MTPAEYYALTPYEQLQALNAGVAPPGVTPPRGVASSNFDPEDGEGYVSFQDDGGTQVRTTPGSSWVSFDQGPSNQTTTTRGLSDFEQYLYNSMTPEQQAATIEAGVAHQNSPLFGQQAPQIRYAASGGDNAYLPPELQAINRSNTRIENAATQNQAAIDKLEALAAQDKNRDVIARMSSQIDAQDPRNAAYVAQSRALAEELGGYRNTANQGSLNALNNYTSRLNQIDASNDAAIGGLTDVYGRLSNPIQANLTSQAAIADPQALAAQNQALAQLGGTANGALDYSSQAAGAYADPKYVAMRDQGLADLYNVSKGSKDVHVGQEDPAAYAAAMDAFSKASAGTNPAVSDAERFLYEQARQTWEAEERGLQAARMSNLRRRGMAGGGAEFTSGALASQKISQNRVLADLAASAQAVQRAQGMLQLQGQISGQLNSEANALGVGNANRQLQALGLYQQGAETAQQSSFDQEYKRGMAADQASRDNQATRLGGQVAYGNQANAMQDDAFNRNAAADNMAMYNKSFEQRERDALWGRTTDVTGLTLNANQQKSQNAGNAFGATTSVLNNNYVRDQEYVSAKDLANTRENAGNQAQLDRRLNLGNTEIGVNNQALANATNITGMGIQGNQWAGQQLAAGDMAVGGYWASRDALKAMGEASDRAAREAEGKGIFGTPIGAPNDPFMPTNWFSSEGRARIRRGIGV